MNLLALPVPGRVAERRLDFTVEAADATHLPEMAAIYREQIAAGLGSFEDPLPDAAELGRRLAAVREAGLPAYVAVDGDGRVLGFCWARPFRAIAAYSETVEDSIHVASDARRHGVGRALLEALIAACSKLDCRADDRGGRRRPQPGLDPAAREPRLQGRGLSARCGSETVRRG